MSKTKFKLNRKGVRELLKSEGMAGICREHAEAISRRCGEGYEVSAYTGKTRVNASVYAATCEAIRDNLENNTLGKMMRS